MQGLFVLSSPWPILLTYIDIDGIARLLFCSLVFFFLIYMLLKCYYPIPANLSINQCYGQLSPEKAFCTSIINMRTYIYLCVTIFVLQFFCLSVRPKGCKRDTVKRIKPLGWCWFVFKVCCCSIIIVLLPEIWEFN